MIGKNEQKEIDLLDYWRIIIKRRWIFISFTGALIFFTGLLSFLATPKYRSTAVLLIEDDNARMLSLDDTFDSRTPVLRDLRFFNTQLRLLKSKTLAERVARKLNLLSRPEFGTGKKLKKGLFASVKDFLTLKWLSSKKDSNERKAKPLIPIHPYSDIANRIRHKIEVDPIRETKLIEVSYISPVPALAAEIVNTVADEFINFSIEKRYENTQMASNFLSEQIASIREDLASKEMELQKYGEEKDLIFLNDSESAVVNTFDDLSQAYTQAKIDRITAETHYRQLKDLGPDTLPEFVNNTTIQQLNVEYKRVKSEYEENREVFKPDHPEMVRLRARIASMQDEIKKAVEGIETEYRTSLRKERNLQAALERARQDVSEMKSNAILYNSLKIEVETIRNSLNSLTAKQRETLISSRLGGLRASNISIIDPAEITRNPVSPKTKMNLILAFIFGSFGGIGLCFVLEYLDNTIKGPDDVERLAKLPSLGIISYLPIDSSEGEKIKIYGGSDSPIYETLPDIKEVALINHLYPKLFIAEDYRTVRTSLLLSHVNSPPRIIAFTSALPKEGKTTTVTNIAVSFAQLEKKVLLIDTDLRKPRLHQIFNAKNDKGVVGYLTGRYSLEEAVQPTSIDHIVLLTSGYIPPNPAELLNSERMRMLLEEVKEIYDVILIDTSPVMAVVDPVITTFLADTTVFIVRAGKTTNKNFVYAIEELRKANVDISGVVFNEVKMDNGYNYMSYYNYSRTSYYIQEGVEIDE